MPHYTLPVSPDMGPVLMVKVGVSKDQFQGLLAEGKTPPAPLEIPFLVDTGASHSSIDLATIAPLKLNTSGLVMVHTPSTGGVPVERETYAVSLYIYHEENSKFIALLPMTAVDFSEQPVKGLLGRDFLRSCLLVYDGAAGTFAIAF